MPAGRRWGCGGGGLQARDLAQNAVVAGDGNQGVAAAAVAAAVVGRNEGLALERVVEALDGAVVFAALGLR